MTSVFGRLFKKKSIEKDAERVFTNQEFDEMFIIPKKVLSFVCIPMAHNITARRAIFWNFFYWLEMTNILMCVPTEFLGMVVSATTARNFQEGAKMFRMIPCFGTVVLSLVKSFKMKNNRTTYENLHRELREMWLTGKVTEEEHRIISPLSNLLNFIVKGYYWGNNTLLTIFLYPSFYYCLRRYLGYDAPMTLPFDYLLPYNAFQPVVLEIMLLLQTYGGIYLNLNITMNSGVVVIWSNVAWDMLFCVYIAHITMQFELLSLRVRRLIYVRVDQQLDASYPLATVSQEIVEDNKDFLNTSRQGDWEMKQLRELTDIVNTHHRLIRLAGDMEAMFSFALLVNFMNSTMIICFCGFCCVLLEKWNELAYKSFFLVAMSQTWLLCWFGQKLIDSSLGLSQALYECGWYSSCKKIRSSILIMLLRSQKCICVTTYGFSIISLASYTTIIKTSWSYFTLLHNIYTR